ncbi:type VII secretion protein EccB [Mycolicibacterium brumae]|uniref:Type VII secretion protein EccB n=1 Tax=Mycolicibacterium brumae TaxID=85968 RepID=A0A2G5PEJ5_9MYCO|nr:type VII secretion protein EccB [Mycolicibacterium brumae]MCV7191758.1 type VII secretion protein EccB [Mycolicibacterium brumae]PIB76354.1 type VII secretion protein EccB [Mycolicibacterium brumae]RWA15867.1 hypothetical protein MBRU_09970 [Mycolicibacterium brumae DSM 44177]UWW07064.1 type VII secretion protein EccB [Mycolicibacterium brumae]
MPLNLSNRDQNSGHLFYNRRLRAALTRFSVRMRHDDRKQQAALALGMVFVLIGVGWMALLHIMKPAGLVGDSDIVGDRRTGAVYARIDGRLHPALNLTSARLVTGNAAAPTWVSSAEIAKSPTGPMIGIPGAPDDFAVTGAASVWTLCDTAPTVGGRTEPLVTAIAGPLDRGRAAELPEQQAVLASHDGDTLLVWNGHRARIDYRDRALTFNLGLDPGHTRPVPISTALFDALPASEPIVVPRIPGAGQDSRWLPGTPVGTVLATRAATGTSNGFYVLLPDGIQQISEFVADLLRTAVGQQTAAPPLIAPDRLVGVPDVDLLAVDHYPNRRLEFVDTGARPVTCLSWEKLGTDRQAISTVLSGRGLPTPVSADARLVRLVRDDRSPDAVEADQVLVLPGAANLVASTSALPVSGTRESLYWISPQGVRYGIEWDERTLTALGVDAAAAVQAPWPLVRVFAPGPAISRTAALVARDSVGGS